MVSWRDGDVRNFAAKWHRNMRQNVTIMQRWYRRASVAAQQSAFKGRGAIPEERLLFTNHCAVTLL